MKIRKIETHKVNLSNDLIEIVAIGEPGSGGANHNYRAYWPHSAGVEGVDFKFQNGPISECGVNGLTHEVLLAIVADRLESFQRGPYACAENGDALGHVVAAMNTLKTRTLARMKRGVEGTSQV